MKIYDIQLAITIWVRSVAQSRDTASCATGNCYSLWYYYLQSVFSIATLNLYFVAIETCLRIARSDVPE